MHRRSGSSVETSIITLAAVAHTLVSDVATVIRIDTSSDPDATQLAVMIPETGKK